jgi:glycosyltransferase involved in cell wall biosynthesis
MTRRTPRVGVSLMAIKEGMIGGLASYALQVSRALALQAPERYVFFVPSALAEFWTEWLPAGAQVAPVDVKNESSTIRSLVDILRIPREASRAGCDLLFYPNTTAPVLAYPRPVVTVFDVMYRSQDHNTPFHKRLYLDFCFWALGRANCPVVTISKFSRDDLALRTSIDHDRIVPVYCGVDEQFFQVESPTPVPGVPVAPYLLSVGATYPHKRLPLIVEAFERIVDEYPDLRLILAGTEHGGATERAHLLERVAASPAADRIIRLEKLPWELMPALYRGAAALVQSSQFEGFGFPIAEAMAVGIPVAAAPASAVVELLGGLGEVSEGWDATSLADAIRRVLAWTPEVRAERVRMARARAQDDFSWPAIAHRLDHLFADLAN